MLRRTQRQRELIWTFMNKERRARLQGNGWRFGSPTDFLELSTADSAFLETKLALSDSLRARRTAQRVSRATLAKRLNVRQVQIAKMEDADQTVSIDLLLRALFALGAKPRDVAVAIQKRRSAAA
jgi:hypothetical protein